MFGTIVFSMVLKIADVVAPAIFELIEATFILLAHLFPQIGIFVTTFFTAFSTDEDIFATDLIRLIKGVESFVFKVLPVKDFAADLTGAR